MRSEFWSAKRKTRFAVASSVTAAALTAGLLVAGGSPAVAATGCKVTYTVNQWDTGFTANIAVTNLGDPVSSWNVEWDFGGNQQVQQGWSATYSQSGKHVSAKNPSWGGNLGTNATASFGFNGSYSGTNDIPTSFSLNGAHCDGTPTTTTPTTPTTTATPTTTTTPTTSTTPTTPTTVTTTPQPGTHVENPYAGSKGYVNPDWSAQVSAAAAAKGGTLGAQMAKVANTSTAVWLDRIAAIAGTSSSRGLRAHLDAALAQQTGSTPVTIQIVVYDLPNRDCAALASNGELKVSENGLARYKAEYIDPIASILSDAKYRSLRVVAIVEPDSLPNLITNLGTAKCAEAQSSGAYVQGIQYALNKLHAISNVYNYLDIAHSAWLGWDSNFGPFVNSVKQMLQGTTAGVNSVDGFISSTANYTPLTEPNLPDPNLNVGGQALKSAKFYQWNPYFAEVPFATAMYNAFVAAGLPSGIGMLVDTSRNGWGGAARPSGASGSTVDAYVDSGRIDRRLHRGNWCNQSGAGLGVRPTVAPQAHFDAYVWIKPPGESDGASQQIPNDEGKGADPMCDPTFHGSEQANGGNLTGALPNAPLSGKWFGAQFEQLVQNAYPPVQ
ncbi:Cellulase/cellobiase CelA1 [Amycolatopsis tolypomycina]|uniref:Glucanase n=1 Tax=Amycolatopsis tolypomycina TaxID=208445 RepID=A0A1H4UNA3_9PSEU|nr:glycoside hydrolase family 6 protein [Amycolatopsis tolypomycina]SEC70196.1 Cellulase/cellobiase CelA1 [Amycolatopsis tolypomycina]